jgi:lipopolysaccharide export LptBFGC system permease protein LptF
MFTILDRYILGRFLANFAILFTLLFLFAVTIDLILSLDRFLEVMGDLSHDDQGALLRLVSFLSLAVDFEAPRFFQFYGYLHGLVSIGAMAFTLAQMYRHKELVAALASGLSMQRIAMPFVVGIFALSVLQLLNQELLLPKVAPLLLRDHGDIGQRSIERFPIRFTPDASGSLFQAPSFDPATRTMEWVTILERDADGRTTRRITADQAVWVSSDQSDDGPGAWALTNGEAVTLLQQTADSPQGAPSLREPITIYQTDLTPEVLVVRRHSEFAGMLSLRQIGRMLSTPGVAEQPQLISTLLRNRFSRFSAVLINVLVMWLTLPTFLIRQPANLLTRSIVCAGLAIPTLLGAAVFMMMELPGISAAVGVFLPVLILLPIVLAQWAYVRT